MAKEEALNRTNDRCSGYEFKSFAVCVINIKYREISNEKITKKVNDKINGHNEGCWCARKFSNETG